MQSKLSYNILDYNILDCILKYWSLDYVNIRFYLSSTQRIILLVLSRWRHLFHLHAKLKYAFHVVKRLMTDFGEDKKRNFTNCRNPA